MSDVSTTLNFILLNYPRSGSNFLSYIIQNITKCVPLKNHGATLNFWTGGALQKYLDEGWLCDASELDVKKELYYSVMPILFILRDYKECIPRQTSSYTYDEKFKDALQNKFPSGNEVHQHHYDYIRLLQHYEQALQPKCLIFYEDLIKNTKNEILRALDFIVSVGERYDAGMKEHVLNNLDLYRKESLENYGKITTPSMSGGNDPTYHQRKMSKETIKMVNEYVFGNYSSLANKYLLRYLSQ